MSDVGVTPPATGIWYDVDDTAEAVFHILRLHGEDIDADRIRGLVPTVGLGVEAYVDSDTVIDGPPPAADLQYALEQGVIVLYRALIPAPDLYLPGAAQLLRPLFDSVIPHRRARAGVA
jgi:hypothetical protein